MRVLITGAGGFFGKALVRAFAQGGEEVVAADRGPASSFTPRPGSDGVTYLQMDVTDRAALAPERVGKIDAIVSAAALTPSVEEMTADPDALVNVNLIGTLNLFELARAQGATKFLFISSGGVYDQFTETTLHEADADGGFSLYGSAKLAAEIMLWRYGRMYGWDTGAVRPTSMYGPAEEFRPTRPFVTAVKVLVDAALGGTPVRIVNGKDRCDWIYVDDVAETSYRFFTDGMGERVFNLSSDGPVPFDRVVSAASSSAGLVVDESAEQVVDGGPDRPTIISNARAKKEIGLKPRSLEEGIAAYVKEVTSGS